MDYNLHISSDPKVMLGKPVIKGTRITVELLLELLSQGAPIDEILTMYPHITRDDVLASISFAHDVVLNVESITA
jgi:uncharacterized protein (DUF433 family)